MRHRRSACATSSAVRLPAHRVFRIVQGGVLPIWRCTVRLLHRPRTQEQRAPCLRRTCCLAWGLSSLSFVGGRIKRPTGRGGMAVRPCTPRGTARSLDPCLQYGGIREERAIVGDRKGSRYVLGVTVGWRVNGRAKGVNREARLGGLFSSLVAGRGESAANTSYGYELREKFPKRGRRDRVVTCKCSPRRATRRRGPVSERTQHA